MKRFATLPAARSPLPETPGRPINCKPLYSVPCAFSMTRLGANLMYGVDVRFQAHVIPITPRPELFISKHLLKKVERLFYFANIKTGLSIVMTRSSCSQAWRISFATPKSPRKDTPSRNFKLVVPPRMRSSNKVLIFGIPKL